MCYFVKNLIYFGTLVLFFFQIAACAELPPIDVQSQVPLESDVHIPSQEEWVDYGTIFEAGQKGEWDYYLWGGFAFSVLKKDDNYFLYYQGASDYRTAYDESVLWRAIGVATSTDGIHFSKYNGNPILTWFPNQYGEEGAVSSGVTLDDQGDVFLYYGANTQETIVTINADVRVASSFNGLTFTDLGLALDQKDRSLWGRGDEIFVVDAIYNQDQGWVIYYIPNGTSETGQLGVAFGEQYDNLNKSAPVLSDNERISVWGTAGHVKLDDDIYALVLNNVRENRSEVRLVSLLTPNIVSEPVAIYQFEDAQQISLLLDEEKELWFMYYRAVDNRYGVKLAPASDQAILPPIAP